MGRWRGSGNASTYSSGTRAFVAVCFGEPIAWTSPEADSDTLAAIRGSSEFGTS